MNSISALHPYTYSVAILFIVILCKTVITHFVAHRPMVLFRFYCSRLADKVNKSSNSKNQQIIAGFFAIIITLPPVIIMLWLFADFIEVQWLWQAFLLYLALDGLDLSQTSTKIAHALNTHNNDKAKLLLKPLVLRNTDKLSSLGLNKTTIEMQLLQTVQQLVCVGFFFILAGPLTALSYRLMLEMHYSWNVKQTKFQYFGKWINLLIQLLQWLPVRAFTLCFLFANLRNGLQLISKTCKGNFFKFNNSIVIAALAYRVNIKLAGVAMYNQQKLRRIIINEQGKQPNCQDILISKKHINQTLFFIASSLLLSAIAAAFLAYNT